MSKVLTGVQDDRIFFKPVRKPDPPKYDSSQPEKMEVKVMYLIKTEYMLVFILTSHTLLYHQ